MNEAITQMKGAPGEGSQPQVDIKELHEGYRDQGAPQAQNEIRKEHSDGRDRGKAAVQIWIKELQDDGRNRGKAAAQRDTEELHIDDRDRGKSALQSEIEEMYDARRDRGKALALCEIETDFEALEKKYNIYPSIIPSSINEIWKWAEEMEQLQIKDEAAEAARKNENSLFLGNQRGKLKKALDRVKGAAAAARWGDGSSRGVSLAEIRRKFEEMLKKQTWKGMKVGKNGGERPVKKKKMHRQA